MLELKELWKHLKVGRGVEEKVLENKEEVAISWIEWVVQRDFAEHWDLPVV